MQKNTLLKLYMLLLVNYSSTMVREKVAKGEEIQAFVPEFIMDYIKDHGLYTTKIAR